MPGMVGGEEVASEPEMEEVDNNKKVSALCSQLL
jgi:pre-mRNA-splicing factor CWC22